MYSIIRPLFRSSTRSSHLRSLQCIISSSSSSNHINNIHNISTRSFHHTNHMKKRDYYDILGVKKGADKSEIKRKYFELAKKYHPDVKETSRPQ